MESSSVRLSSPLGGGSLEPSTVTLAAVTRDESDRNPIFDALVSSDGEISGLVAYSIYKQNKRDWLEDFKKLVGRLPTEAETRSYIIGESTDRRLATYRQLAQATLGQQPSRAGSAAMGSSSAMAGAVWVLAIIVALGIVGYGLHAFNLLGGK